MEMEINGAFLIFQSGSRGGNIFASAKNGHERRTQGRKGSGKAKQFLKEKIAASKDGTLYLYDTDIKAIIEAAKGDNAGGSRGKSGFTGAEKSLIAVDVIVCAKQTNVL